MIPLPSLTVLQFWTFIQVLTRFSALVAIAPIFGAKQVPSQVKMGIAVLVSIAITPALQSVIGTSLPTSLFDFGSAIAFQALIGLLMGFVVSMILAAFQMAGTLLDQQIGFSMGQTFNPAINITEAPIGQFQYLYALMIFLLANGHHILIFAVTKSFMMIPISKIALAGSGMQFMTDVTMNALSNAVMIAAPTCAVLLLVDVTFALLSRAMPQMNAFFIGMPAKVIAGLIVLVIILPATAVFAGQLVNGEPQMLSDLLRSMTKTKV
jgi:flagellar biosynthetic protein FliR